MIISDEYKLIFIHIPKNAGNYIRQVLFKLDPNIINFTFNDSSHIMAKNCIQLIGVDKWDTYTKFCVKRDIYSKTISYYNYVRNTENHFQHEIIKDLTLEQFVNFIETSDIHFINENILNDTYIYDDDGERLIDNILTFENIEKRINRFYEKYKYRYI